MIDFSSHLSAVRIQDLTLVVLCALAVYLFRVREQYIVQPQWRKDFDLKNYANMKFPGLDERLPRPIITDLESDGSNEIVLISDNFDLQVLVIPTKHDDLLLPQIKIKNTSALPVTHQEDGLISRPVAMETGYLVPYNSPNRTQVIVVVLDSWKVLCYDHTLNLLWEQQLMDVGQAHEHHYVKSMGILIVPAVVMRSDRGTVIVGGSFAHRTHQRRQHMPQTGSGPDPQRHHAQKLGQAARDKDLAFTHFSTFALSGDNGTVRWHHLPGDFKPDISKLPSKQNPHHWKLSLKKGRLHDGEQQWTKYAASFKSQMPHTWTELRDTKITLANVRPGTTDSKPGPTEPSAVVEDLFGLQGEHLIGYAYGGMRPHSPHEHVKNPNTIVIHNQNGIEFLALQSGRPFTRFYVPEEKASFADVNDDGVIDRVMMVFSHDNEECFGVASSVSVITSEVFSESVCSAPSWWQSISLSAAFFPDPTVSEDTHLAVSPVLVPSIAHKSGPFHHLMGRTLPSQRAGYDSIFLTSAGRLTSYGPHGEFNWQVNIPAKWVSISHIVQGGNLDSSEVVQTFYKAFKPSMTAFSPQIYGRKTTLLVLGWDQLAVVDLRDGYIMAQHSLPCRPLTTPVLGDFNTNGWTDFIVACPQGYVGFSVQSQHNYGYMVVVSTAVVLTVLLLTWCCKPGEDNDHDS